MQLQHLLELACISHKITLLLSRPSFHLYFFSYEMQFFQVLLKKLHKEFIHYLETEGPIQGAVTWRSRVVTAGLGRLCRTEHV